jgi:hypothetical protein
MSEERYEVRNLFVTNFFNFNDIYLKKTAAKVIIFSKYDIHNARNDYILACSADKPAGNE